MGVYVAGGLYSHVQVKDSVPRDALHPQLAWESTIDGERLGDDMMTGSFAPTRIHAIGSMCRSNVNI